MLCKSGSHFSWIITLWITICVLIHDYGVGAARQRFETMARLAFEHGMRVNELAQCDAPKPELIYLKEPNKVYLPRATLLHRCSDSTGCCPHATQTCMALETRSIDLYFYTIVLKANQLNPRKVQQMQNIDRITFTNHTKCGCRTRQEYLSHNSIFDPAADHHPVHTNQLNNNFSNSL